MPQSEKQVVTQGVTTEEGLPNRDYSISIPEKANDPSLAEVEDLMNAPIPEGTLETVPEERVLDYKPTSIQSKSDVALQAQAIRQAQEFGTQDDVLRSWDEMLQKVDPKFDRARYANANTENRQKDLEEQYMNGSYANADEAVAAAQKVANEEALLDEERKNPHLAYVRAIQRDYGVNAAHIANQIKTAEMVKEIWDGMSKAEVGLEIGAMLIPGEQLFAQGQVRGNPFEAQEFLKNLVINYTRATPEDQAKMLPVIRDDLLENISSKLRVMEVLNAMAEGNPDPELMGFDNLFGALDVAAIGGTALSLATKINRFTKGLNAVKVANEVGNTERASTLAASAVTDARRGELLGLDRTEVANIASPFNMAELDPAYTKGMSHQVIKDITKFAKDAERVQADVVSSEAFVKEGLLDPLDRAVREGSFVTEWQDLDKVENVEVVSRTGNTTTFTAQKGSEQVTETLTLSLDDVGTYEATTMNMWKEHVLSPNAALRVNESLEEFVASGIRLDSAQARLLNHFRDLYAKATKEVLGPLGLKGLNPLSRRRLDQIGHVLMIGDTRGEVFNYRQLKAGVDGVKLDDKQIEGYFKLRKLMDTFWHIRNVEKRNEKMTLGYKHIHVTDDIQEVGKPFADYQAAKSSIVASQPKRIFDTKNMKDIMVEGLDLEAEYEKGNRLVRLEEASSFQTLKDARRSYALVPAESIRELPMKVIPYKQGYVPKYNKNVIALVKEFKTIDIDGKPTVINTGTHRAFDNFSDAQMMEKQLNFDAKGTGVEYRAVLDRQLEAEARLSGGEGASGGGMFTGSRKGEDLAFGWEGNKIERTGTFESISRAMSNLARFIPRNEWRMGVQQKVVNTANKILPPNRHVTHFNDILKLGDTSQERFLKKLHKQVETWMGFPSKQEQIWSSFVQGVYERLIGSGLLKSGGKTSSIVGYVRDKNPIQAARAFAFDTLLGWFNPIQTWVQAQGAAVAISQVGVHEWPKVFGLQSALAQAGWFENSQLARLVAKASGLDADEFVALHKAWIRSGLQDSVLTTADHAAAMEGRGTTMDALSRLNEKGLLFYRTGELFNRRVSFVSAYKQFVKDNPGKKLDDIAIKQILKRANDYMLNLTKANRAAWQEGILGIPTQFLQVGAKTLETLFGFNRTMTAAERMKLLSGQVFLYGAAGIPLGNLGASMLAGLMGYKDQNDVDKHMPPEVRKVLNEGFTGLATLSIFGIDIEIGKRSSLTGSVTDFVDKMLFDDEPTAKALFGAFGVGASRFWDAMRATYTFSYDAAVNRTIEDPIKTVRRFAKTASSWNNVEKALLMHNLNMMLNSRGQKVTSRDFTLMEEFAVGMGFRLSEEVQMYQQQDILRAKSAYESRMADEITNTYYEMTILRDKGELSPSLENDMLEKIAMAYQLMPTKQEKMDLRDQVERRLMQGDDLVAKTWQKWYKEFNDARDAELYDMHQLLSTYPIQQNTNVEK